MHAESSAQVFDDASRGPWGAFKFILTSTNVALLGSCASILTIAALMIDPFSQLVLTFPTRATPATGQVASLKVGEAYDAHTTLFDNHGGGIAVGEQSAFRNQAMGLIRNLQRRMHPSICRARSYPQRLEWTQFSSLIVLRPIVHIRP